MQSIRRQFLLSSTENLRALQADIRQKENISQDFFNEIFRSLHTVKGTAQTFGFVSASRLAHELENLLSAAKNGKIAPDKNLLQEGIEALIQSLQSENFEIPAGLLEKIYDLIPDQTNSDISWFGLPEKISARLSAQEKEAVSAVLQNRESLFCLEVGFTLAEFAVRLKKFREELNRHGKVLAVFPGEKIDAEISFQLLFSAENQITEVEETARDFSAEIIFQKNADLNPGEDFQIILAQITAHGKNTAWQFGKNVEFETSFEAVKLSDEKIKIIFDALLHLIKNAVDHAIETPESRIAKGKNVKGKIKIALKQQENKLNLTISDDGSGIDPEKVREKAFEKNLIHADKTLSERETLDLIFLPGFTTAETVSETSGRGVGLDAVREMIENAGGGIDIKTQKDVGTTFEIVLPI